MRNDVMFQNFFQNALIGLENGQLMPWDKELLSSNPLPSSVIDPYTDKEVKDVLESMQLTFSAMSVWIEEAKKVNYFSKRFVQLSKMVMNGVTIMGRGLVTLHQRGEDPAAAPMSIHDLIGIASYHFRKSYLGVLQTSAKNPEIGERLLMNQISWNNILLRLFKTRDKLAKQIEITDRKAELTAGTGDMCLLAEAEDQKAAELPASSDLPAHVSDSSASVSAFSSLSAITEPAAFSAPRAFSSFDNKKSEKGNQRSHTGEQKNIIKTEDRKRLPNHTPETGNDEVRNKNEEKTAENKNQEPTERRNETQDPDQQIQESNETPVCDSINTEETQNHTRISCSESNEAALISHETGSGLPSGPEAESLPNEGIILHKPVKYETGTLPGQVIQMYPILQDPDSS